MEQGWDPEVKKFFVRILNTISYGLLWLLSAFTAGFYFGLATRTDRPLYMFIYYLLLLVSLFFLLRYFYRSWKK